MNNMANLVTLLRLLLVFVISSLALYATPQWQLLNLPLVILCISLDALDGFVARIRHEVTVFGAIFDIAVDRVVEIVLWLVLAKLNLVSVWIAIIFVTRGILVDSLRNQNATAEVAPFNTMRTAIGKYLVASRFMRFFYALIKLITFAWLLFIPPFMVIWPVAWLSHAGLWSFVTDVLVYITLFLCLVRGLPVFVEVVMIEMWKK
jgi:CDP-diacylglycerol--glycerol-3-phosphate 3-phosphatidyltransferase